MQQILELEDNQSQYHTVEIDGKSMIAEVNLSIENDKPQRKKYDQKYRKQWEQIDRFKGKIFFQISFVTILTHISCQITYFLFLVCFIFLKQDVGKNTSCMLEYT